MASVALLSNPRSTGNRSLLPQVREFCAAHPDIFHYEVEDVGQIGEAIRTIAMVSPSVVAINGGDGTVQAALTELHSGGHFDGSPPPVAVLPNGKTNLIAEALGRQEAQIALQFVGGHGVVAETLQEVRAGVVIFGDFGVTLDGALDGHQCVARLAAGVEHAGDAVQGRRTALANWITDDNNPLAARVMVNRLWQRTFGKAIAGNPNNFGATGKRPTHPDLLDWLAVEFQRSGGSTKHIMKLLLNSEAYRRADYWYPTGSIFNGGSATDESRQAFPIDKPLP